MFSKSFKWLWKFIDQIIGADRTDAGSRGLLLSEQLKAVLRMTPAMGAGTIVICASLLAVTWGTSQMPVVGVWSILMSTIWIWALRSWKRSKHRDPTRHNPHKAARRAVSVAAVLGAAWGTIPLLLLPATTQTQEIAIPVIMCSVIFTAAISYSSLPQAAFAFLLPLIVFCLGGTQLLNADLASTVLAAMLVGFVPIIGTVIVHLGRSFVEHVRRELKFRDQKNVISLLLREFEENTSDWLWEFDASGHIVRASERFCAASGLSAAELIGRDFTNYLASIIGSEAGQLDEILEAVAKRETFDGIEVTVSTGEKDAVWRLSGKASFDPNGKYTGYIGTASDVTAEKTAENKIAYLAHYDALTGLLNRARFGDMLGQCVSRLERYGAPFSVFYLDLDRFKLVNDRSGHLAGDKLLVEVANRIRGEVRESDVVARLGGDEFAIILPNLADAGEASQLAERLVNSISEPFPIDGESLSVGLSVGIAIAPINGTRPDQILRNADLALYRAKEEGRGMFRFFEAEMDSNARERRLLEIELRQALLDGEFVLHYQPLVSAETGSPSGFEALLRWDHQLRGIVPPAEFFPIAEQSGLIQELGDWTIMEACRSAASWPNDLTVAVNLSPKHFMLSDIEAVVREALEESGIAPERLELEITESLLIERSDEALEKLNRLKDIGVTIAMDDFGTGYSSLSYLLKFPFDKIKIDRSFVTALTNDPAAQDVLRSIVSLGKTLKMNVTAEGVENNEQAKFLRDVACNHFQGFLFSRPMGGEEMSSYLLSEFARDTLNPVADEVLAGKEVKKSA